VAEGVGPGGECPARKVISDLPGSGELGSEEPLAKAEKGASATETKSDQKQLASMNHAEMRRVSYSRKRNLAWGI
jgi:hypothetical protein